MLCSAVVLCSALVCRASGGAFRPSRLPRARTYPNRSKRPSMRLKVRSSAPPRLLGVFSSVLQDASCARGRARLRRGCNDSDVADNWLFHSQRCTMRTRAQRQMQHVTRACTGWEMIPSKVLSYLSVGECARGPGCSQNLSSRWLRRPRSSARGYWRATRSVEMSTASCTPWPLLAGRSCGLPD